MVSNYVAADISEYRILAYNLSTIQTVSYRNIYCMYFIQQCNSHELYSVHVSKISLS